MIQGTGCRCAECAGCTAMTVASTLGSSIAWVPNIEIGDIPAQVTARISESNLPCRPLPMVCSSIIPIRSSTIPPFRSDDKGKHDKKRAAQSWVALFEYRPYLPAGGLNNRYEKSLWGSFLSVRGKTNSDPNPPRMGLTCTTAMLYLGHPINSKGGTQWQR
jgi:hypothetical protein